MDGYLLFPSECSLTTGTLVGFHLSAVTVVIGVINGTNRAHHTDDELDLLLARCWDDQDRPTLERLGTIDCADQQQPPGGDELRLTISPTGIRSLREMQTLVLYDRPNPSKHHFLSLAPLELDVTHNARPSSRTHALDASESATPVSRGRQRTDKHAGALREAVQLINAADSIDRRIHRELSAGTPSVHAKRTDVPWRPSEVLVGRLRTVPLFLLRVLHTRLPFGGPLLKDSSATVNQIDVRAEQAAFLPTQLAVLSPATPSKSANPASRARYINFYTILWLIANDVIVGRALGLVLCEQSEPWGVYCAGVAERYAIEIPSATLRWLDAWPGGLKLNTDLSRFISSAFLAVIASWDQVIISPLLPLFPRVLFVIGLSGTLGTTMALSLLSDLLSILTAHLYVAYLLATVSFRWMRTMLGTLFNVFRGKRTNVLRNRLDTNDYTVDQLLLGTVLFTLFAFLFPTVLAYYLFFAASRFLIIFGHAGLETCLAFMNHFPLFAVMLRLKDPSRLPGGIALVPWPPDGPTHLRLENQPISLGRIFFQHLALVSRLSAHYSPLRLIRKLAKGETIRPIERFQIRYDGGGDG